MACVVKECKPNMLGDMLITMKVSYFKWLWCTPTFSYHLCWKWLYQDPSDIVKASIHNKVLKDAKFGSDIVVGSVLLLKEVQKQGTHFLKYYLSSS